MGALVCALMMVPKTVPALCAPNDVAVTSVIGTNKEAARNAHAPIIAGNTSRGSVESADPLESDSTLDLLGAVVLTPRGLPASASADRGDRWPGNGIRAIARKFLRRHA